MRARRRGSRVAVGIAIGLTLTVGACGSGMSREDCIRDAKALTSELDANNRTLEKDQERGKISDQATLDEAQRLQQRSKELKEKCPT